MDTPTVSSSVIEGNLHSGRPVGPFHLEDITAEARSQPDHAGHERVLALTDDGAVRGFIAIHDRTLGPALGGCRMWPYPGRREALADVLRLSQGMTLKAAIAGVAAGGGKCVVIGNSRTDKSDALLRALADALDVLEGQFYTGEDVGISVDDADLLASWSDYVVGSSLRGGGDPSPITALGVSAGIRAAIRHRGGRRGLYGTTVAVQGLGKVGFELCRLLHDGGARLIVSDIDAAAVARARHAFDAEEVPGEDIYAVAADVFAPCALGGVLNEDTAGRLNCGIVAGSANNQLQHPAVGEALHRRGILYAPDFVINAGGLISVAQELGAKGYSYEEARRTTLRIGDTLAEIFARADREQVAPSTIAEHIAHERLVIGRPLADGRTSCRRSGV